jgi:hypothetical protein
MSSINLFNEFITSEQLEIYKNKNLDKYTKYIKQTDLEKIFETIDKTDYTFMSCDRWINLEFILDSLINKKEDNDLELDKLIITSMHETFPPQIKYQLVFTK